MRAWVERGHRPPIKGGHGIGQELVVEGEGDIHDHEPPTRTHFLMVLSPGLPVPALLDPGKYCLSVKTVAQAWPENSLQCSHQR